MGALQQTLDIKESVTALEFPQESSLLITNLGTIDFQRVACESQLCRHP